MLGLVFIASKALASPDQLIEIEAFSRIDNGAASKYKAECNQIGKAAELRMDAFLKANPDVDPKQVNVSTKFFVDVESRGGVMTAHQPTWTQYCMLRVRLNDEKRKLTLGMSEVYYTGRAKLKPCMNLKTEIDQKVNVIYSEVNNNIFRCNIKPIISIE